MFGLFSFNLVLFLGVDNGWDLAGLYVEDQVLCYYMAILLVMSIYLVHFNSRFYFDPSYL